MTRKLSSHGAPPKGNLYTQAESYIVELAFKCDMAMENIVISDLLPAGFEIVNSRLEPDSAGVTNIGPAATPSFLDMRDDRLVIAFDKLKEGQHRFYYAVRAVTPGTFVYPAATSECMYDAGIRARTETTSIEIR